MCLFTESRNADRWWLLLPAFNALILSSFFFLLSSFFFLRIKISTKFCSFFDLTIDHRIIGYYYTSHLSSCCLLTVVLATTTNINDSHEDRLLASRAMVVAMHDDSDTI